MATTSTSTSTADTLPDPHLPNPHPHKRPPRIPRPIVYWVIGAAGCGKTTFLQKLTHSDPTKPHPTYLPYIIASKNPKTEQTSPQLHFYDETPPHAYDSADSAPTIGYASSDALLPPPALVTGVDVVLLCFDISSREALESVPILFHTLPLAPSAEDTPILLLGLKRDIRDAVPASNTTTAADYSHVATTSADPLPSFPFITPTEGLELAQKLGLERYMECSALLGTAPGGLMDMVEEDIVGAGVALWVSRRVKEAEDKENQGMWEGCTLT